MAKTPASHWNRLAGRRITVLGDLMLDEHIQGAVTRVSPEAPVPVVQVTSRSHHPGGAANVAVNLAALQGSVRLCGVSGRDEAARILHERLGHIDTRGVVESGSRCTSRKTRVLAHGHHHIVRFDEEVTGPLDATEEALLWQALEPAILEDCDVLVLSDYAKGVLTPAICRRAIDAAASRKIPVVVDPKDSDFTKYAGSTVITPNYGEATAAARRRHPALSDLDESDQTAERIGALLVTAYGCSLVLTRGAKGMTVLDGTASPVHIPAQARRVFDVTGAGDTVVAALALALAAGFPLSEAAAMSNEAAGHVIQLPGTAVVTLEELVRNAGI